MRIFLNSLMLAIVLGGIAANLYWQWADHWFAGAVAIVVGYCVCLTIEKTLVRRAYLQMKEEHGEDWSD